MTGPGDRRARTTLLLAGMGGAWLLLGAPASLEPAGSAPAPQVALRAGLVLDRSARIAPGVFRLASASLDAPVLVVRGRDIEIDLRGVELVGSPDDAAPDRFAGLGILIDGGERVTIHGARIRGYKVGLLARHVKGLRLTDTDVSHNWKQYLYSGVEKESLLDWMSYHDNERDEWLRYGAGIYLEDVEDAEIARNRAVQGQNGLMATRSRRLRIWNNEFSFLSAIGIGFYRTSDSAIMHNRIDWCVRGYSHGFYNRGQDSAGLLMYEQSSRNVVAYNSVTHGGDGLFLWAGQSTMDTGEGGANDNLFYANDFSHAPANGIEATFSRNRFVANRIEENWHGVWGGYSFDSVIAGNTFLRNQEGIAIEHGQNNVITGNRFDNDETAIRLWSNLSQNPDWGYPKHRDTRSRDYTIEGNTFRGHKVALDITRTSGIGAAGNTFDGVETVALLKGETPGFRMDAQPASSAAGMEPPAPFPDGLDSMLPPGARRGREHIIVDEWGPYDWRSPKLWPAGRSDESPLRLRVLGPPGRWTEESARGATISAQMGDVPGEIVVSPAGGGVVDWRIDLRYTGTEIVTPSGRTIPAGQPWVFSYGRFSAPVGWTVRFYDFHDTPEAMSNREAFARVTAGTPVRTEQTDRLDYLSSRAMADGVPNDHVAVVAEGEVVLPEGSYELRVIADDGVRVWVDGTLAIDDWSVHESVLDRARLGAGAHRLRVEYFDDTGFAELRVAIVKPPGR